MEAKDAVAGKAADARDSVGEGLGHAGDAIKEKVRRAATESPPPNE